jgi:hypothetical protein
MVAGLTGYPVFTRTLLTSLIYFRKLLKWNEESQARLPIATSSSLMSFGLYEKTTWVHPFHQKNLKKKKKQASAGHHGNPCPSCYCALRWSTPH